MQVFHFKVIVPTLFRNLFGYPSKEFSSGSSEENRDAAFRYCSEIIIHSQESNFLKIYDFIDDSSELTKIENLKTKVYLNDGGILNFPKLFQCKIEYLEDKKISAKDIECGSVNFKDSVFKIQISKDGKKYDDLLSFSNTDVYSQLQIVIKNYDLESLIDINSLYQKPSFKALYELRQLREVLISDDFYNKEIIEDARFLPWKRPFFHC